MKIGPVIVLVIVAIIGYSCYNSAENDRQLAESNKRARAQLEAARTTNADPLMNMAGCMANHASTVSQIFLATTIYQLDSHKAMGKEDAESFAETRDALLEPCGKKYGKAVGEAHPGLTVPELNSAFIQVMREDPEIAKWIEIQAKANEVRKKILLK
jgi:hypothetical protein